MSRSQTSDSGPKPSNFRSLSKSRPSQLVPITRAFYARNGFNGFETIRDSRQHYDGDRRSHKLSIKSLKKAITLLKEKAMMIIRRKSRKKSKYEDDEFSRIEFKSFIESFLPKDFEQKTSYRLAPPKSSLNRIQLRRYCQPSFGHCHYLKLYVFLSFFWAISFYFKDDCVIRLNESGDDDHRKFSSDRFSSTAPESAIIESSFTLIRKRTADESDFFDDPKMADLINNHCLFKLIFILTLTLGMVIYTIIFVVYTSRLVIYFYNFSWYLFESILLLLLALILLFEAVIAYFLTSHTTCTTIGEYSYGSI